MNLSSYLILFALPLALSCRNQPLQLSKEQAAHAERLFSRPLILGASVSAGFGTTDGGPGAVISRMLNPDAEIMNKSMSGHTSVESTRNFELPSPLPSIVLAFDLFFWDAAHNQCGVSFEKNARELFKTFQDKNIPMIVGQVPVGADFPEGIKEAGTKTCTKKINSLLRELCTPEKNCLLYDPVACFEAMGAPVSPEGVRYFSDRLHTTNEGNEFCAREFLAKVDLGKLQSP